MQYVKLQDTTLHDIMLRLDAREEKVFAFAGSGEDGWDTVLCWKPDAVFSSELGDIGALEDFTAEQQRQDRFVAGYLSYDLGAQLHNVELTAKDDLKTPLVFAVSFSNWVQFKNGSATVCATDTSFVECMKQISKREPRNLPLSLYEQTFEPVQPRGSYNNKYQKVKKYIVAGDVYQVNLAHRLEATSAVSSRDLFVALHQNSQSGFQAYIEGDGFEVLSFSPERFIKVDGSSISTSPIKGTRPRGKTKTEDAALREDLRTNPKDTAELNMITDLLRNDIGSISQVGSVQVTEQRALTAYPTLWHTHSTITGELNPQISPVQALATLTPGGSITGCPKKRAIEIIDELEDYRRGVYTGSIFAINPEGKLDSNIAIRTIVKKGKKLYLSVGGGIVHDSVEGDEYQESIDKAASFAQTKSGQLSSDILERQFGPTEIEVLFQDNATRIICTKTIADSQALELSKVEFVQAGVDAYPDIHEEIANGKSMGKAFRGQNVEFTRDIKAAWPQQLPQEFSQTFKQDGEATIVQVTILVGSNNIPYAKILEIYSPVVLWPDKTQNANTQDGVNEFAKTLAQLSTIRH